MVITVFKRILLIVCILGGIILLLFGLHTCNAVKFNKLSLSDLVGTTFVDKDMKKMLNFLQDDIVEIVTKKSDGEPKTDVYTSKQEENIFFLTSDTNQTITLLTISNDELYHKEANVIYYRAVVV